MVKSFIEFEEKNKLFELQVQGINFWHICRFEIYNELLRQDTQMGQAHTSLSGEGFLKRFSLRLKQLPYYITKNPLICLKQKEILIFNHQRRVKNQNYFDCLYTDSWVSKLNMSNYIFEDPILGKHYRPVRTRSIRYTDYIDFKFSIVKRLKKSSVINRENAQIIKDLLTKLNDEFDTQININTWAKKIFLMIETYQYRYGQYKKIITKVNPKIIVEVVSYSPSRFVINDIAKKKGIPTVELQHGVIGSKHIAYNLLNKRSLSMFPDYLFVFGQFWKDNALYPIDSDKIKVVGWPYYEEKVKQYKGRQSNERKRNILFLSQGTIGSQLSSVAVELYKLIDKEKYYITYKLHPGEYARWKEEYPWLINSGIQVIDHNQKDIHYYFAKSNIQVGVYSTTLFEGLGYGLETHICKLHGHEYVEDLYKNNIATLFKTAQELYDHLLIDKRTKHNVDIDYFWTKESLKNMLSGINKVMKK